MDATIPMLIVGCFILLVATCCYCCLRCLRRSGIREQGYYKTKFKRGRGILNDSCPVCLEDFVNKEPVIALLCQHAYHQNCLRPWLQENSKCPMCKADVGNRASNERTPLLLA